MTSKGGIIKKVDELGRVTLPKSLRVILGINPADEIEVHVDGEQVILKKHSKTCCLCGSKEHLAEVREGKFICTDCIQLTPVCNNQ